MRTRLEDERGSALIIALMATVIMLALGIALLSIVDTQAQESDRDRTRDRAFNLAESALAAEAFALGRNWRTASTAICGAPNAGFSDTLRSGSAAGDARRLAPALDAAYTDAAYTGARWQVNVCDDVDGQKVWRRTFVDTQNNADTNNNNRLWVRAQATVAGRTRSVAGLVLVRQQPAFPSKYGLVSGNVDETLGGAVSTITNTTVLSGLTSGLLNTNPPVAPDLPDHPLPGSGVTGLRCGLLSQLETGKTCVTGTLGGLSALPPFDALVNGGRYEQYPSNVSTSDDVIGQLRREAKEFGQYVEPGDSTTTNCGISPANTPDQVAFVERVGTGDQTCTIDVRTSQSYKAVVIASGRLIIEGDGTIATYSESAPKNLLTGVVYALNGQTADHSASTPVRNVVTIRNGARVRGAVHANGKNAAVAIVPPDPDSGSVVNALVCPGALCYLAPVLRALTNGLNLDSTINTLVSGPCLVSLLGVCTVRLPILGAATKVLNNITSQLTTYGSAIHSDVDVIEALKVYGASGVLPGSFRDLQARG